MSLPEAEWQRAEERPQPISYVPDDLEDISEIVRHAEPIEDIPAQPAREEPGSPARAGFARAGVEETPAIETVSSGVNITYDADDLEVPAFMRKRGQS